MNHSKISLILAGAVALAVLPRAFAGHSPEETFRLSDTNNDGQLSRMESAAAGRKMFTDMDTNRDGMISTAEMTAAHAMMADKTMDNGKSMGGDKPAKSMKAGKAAKQDMAAAEMIKMQDRDNDGQLNATEHEAACTAMFAKLDTNGDGMLSRTEAMAGEKMMKQ